MSGAFSPFLALSVMGWLARLDSLSSGEITHKESAMKSLDREFHKLHQQGLLVLANVADAGGARLVESLGSRAVATSSAAMAWAFGYQDGNQLPMDLLVSSVQSMTRVLSVPLTVDIEGGYSDDVEHVAKVVDAIVAAGAVGINIEDGAGPTEWLVRKIDVAKEVANRRGVNLFVNARSDVFLKGIGPAEGRLEETLERAALYAEAGADGFFSPGMIAADDIATLCRTTRLPVNLLAWPGLPGLAQLQELGLRRLSAGANIAEFLYGAMEGVAKAFLQRGDFEAGAIRSCTYPELNELMAPKT